jgi:hypothetical protein
MRSPNVDAQDSDEEPHEVSNRGAPDRSAAEADVC